MRVYIRIYIYVIYHKFFLAHDSGTQSNSFDEMSCRRLILGQLGWAPRLAAFFFFLGHQLRFGPEEFLPLRRGLSERLVGQ